ncbi:hypothetical protein [Herbiconiux sp.]|uniref:FmdB family zinc ribbon protein n=1 Tax=Herbiconiux sp. TaxID=1871186 RepID=UPI0025BB1435|nr:hypothetical protein [Herbiconiux sp.]
MAILVDYRCTACGSRHEAFVASPAPALRTCACGGEARRLFSPVGMISGRGSGGADATTAPAPGTAAAASEARRARKEKAEFASLCAQNPDVPGLCHMSPSAGRAWVARARGDGRALDAELTRQQAAAAISPPTMADAISHEHTHTPALTSPAGEHHA